MLLLRTSKDFFFLVNYKRYAEKANQQRLLLSSCGLLFLFLLFLMFVDDDIMIRSFTRRNCLNISGDQPTSLRHILLALFS